MKNQNLLSINTPSPYDSVLGIHDKVATLRKGDCFDLLKNLPDKSVDLIVTDPPYDLVQRGTVTSGHWEKTQRKVYDQLKKHQDLTQGYDIRLFGEEVSRVMKRMNIYIWCNKKQIPEYLACYHYKRGYNFEVLFWQKTNAMPLYNRHYMNDVEYCLYFWERGAYIQPACYEDAMTVFTAPINQTDKKTYGHPTIKPLNMIERLVRNSSREGDVVLDPFMGSGTTGVAALKNNRNFIGYEIDEHYYNVARNRIENFISSQSQYEIAC
jgi:site-specific DNA-methyltransferase (adenine-specific)